MPEDIKNNESTFPDAEDNQAVLSEEDSKTPTPPDGDGSINNRFNEVKSKIKDIEHILTESGDAFAVHKELNECRIENKTFLTGEEKNIHPWPCPPMGY